jgi:hypothetical protein
MRISDCGMKKEPLMNIIPASSIRIPKSEIHIPLWRVQDFGRSSKICATNGPPVVFSYQGINSNARAFVSLHASENGQPGKTLLKWRTRSKFVRCS